MTSPFVAIIVLNYNNIPDTIECIDSLEGLIYSNYRLIIVDNNGGQKNGEILRAKYEKKHIVLENDQNLGYAEGNNIGIRYALNVLGANYVLILNNDTIINPSFLSRMVESAQSSPSMDMIAARIYRYDQPAIIDSAGLLLQKNGLPYRRKSKKETLFCPSGACALYSKKMLRDVELNGDFFDKDFFLYIEDVDLGFRGVLKGYQTALAEDAIIYHKVSSTTKERSPLSIYYGHRNTPLMILKNFPTKLILKYGLKIFFYQLIIVIYYLFTDPKNVFVVIKSKIDAIKLIPKMVGKRRQIQVLRKISNNDLVKLFQ